MRHIEDCTLVIVDTLNHGEAIAALKKSMEQCSFDKVLFFTNTNIKIDGVEVVQIRLLKSKDDYSLFIIKHLHRYITTKFVLIIQHDGWILNGDLFDEKLYNFDYAGALWPEADGTAINGNGGFSWRSERLLSVLASDSTIKCWSPEDVTICKVYRDYLSKIYGIKWATNEICERFSYELMEPIVPTFGFHGKFHPPFRPTVVINRTGAMGDVVSVEPILRHFHNNGYRVVLNTLPQFANLFIQHDFKVLRYGVDEIDGRYLDNPLYFNLDMAYESNPNQLHLDSYYDVCGIPKEQRVYSKPHLQLAINPAQKEHKLFNKYVVVHVEDRPQPARNILNKQILKSHLRDLEYAGYDIITIGAGSGGFCGTKMNTPTEPFLMWVIGGADLFIGIDSGPSHIAVAMGVPAVIFSGSVDLRLIHPDMEKVEWIQMHERTKVCDKPFCWHSVIGTTGVDCYVSKNDPPCANFNLSPDDIANSLKRFLIYD